MFMTPELITSSTKSAGRLFASAHCTLGKKPKRNAHYISVLKAEKCMRVCFDFFVQCALTNCTLESLPMHNGNITGLPFTVLSRIVHTH